MPESIGFYPRSQMIDYTRRDYDTQQQFNYGSLVASNPVTVYLEQSSSVNANNPSDRKIANPYSWNKDIQSSDRGDWIRRDSSGAEAERFSGVLWVPNSMTVDDQSVIDVRGYNRAVGKVNALIRRELDLTVDLAQAGETKRLVRDVKKILRYTRRFRSLWGIVTGTVKGLGDARLAYMYGIKPLCQDLYDVVSTSHRKVADGRTLTVRTARREQETRSQYVGYNGYLLSRPVIQITSRRTVMSIHVKPRVDLSDLLSDYGTLNPAGLAWELLPYSFVVDWFIDIGGYLRNLETSLLSQHLFEYGFYTQTLKVDCYGLPAVQGNLEYLGSSGWRSWRAKQRFKLSLFPLPKPPRFKANLGSDRLLNAASLLSQLLR